MWFIKRIAPLILIAWLPSGCALLDLAGGESQQSETDTSLDNITVDLKKESKDQPVIDPDESRPTPSEPPKVVYRNTSHQEQAEAAQPDFKRAVRDLKKGDLAPAFERFEQIHTNYPDLVAPLLNMSIILRQQEKYAEAITLLHQAIAITPQDPVLLTELGVLNRYLGNFAEAKTNYESAINVDSNYAKAHYNLGVLADLYLHDPNLALSEFQIFQSLLPEPDKTVTGWIAELERRAKSTQQ